MIQIPPIISSLFGLLTLAVLMLFYRVVKNSNVSKIRSQASPIFIGLAIWTVLQGVLAYTNVYNSDLQTLPPKIALFGILPAFFYNSRVVSDPKKQSIYRQLATQKFDLAAHCPSTCRVWSVFFGRSKNAT